MQKLSCTTPVRPLAAKIQLIHLLGEYTDKVVTNVTIANVSLYKYLPDGFSLIVTFSCLSFVILTDSACRSQKQGMLYGIII